MSSQQNIKNHIETNKIFYPDTVYKTTSTQVTIYLLAIDFYQMRSISNDIKEKKQEKKSFAFNRQS